MIDALTFRNAMASAPHCVTIRVSLVSRVSVSAMIMKNLIDPINKNFSTSSFPWMGKSVRRAFLHEKDDLVVSAVDASALEGAAGVESVVGGVIDCSIESALLGSETSVEGVRPSEFPSVGPVAAPPR